MQRTSLRYALQTSRRDQVWLPAGLWALFAILVLVFRDHPQWVDMVRGFLGAILPLSAGIMAAYAILDDPAREILFATPQPAGHRLAVRLGPILIAVAVAAVTFELLILGLGLDFGLLGGAGSFQLSWLVPSLALAALGACASLALKSCASGAMLVGTVWIIQLIARSWFLSRDAAARLLLFMGIFSPRDSRLAENRITLSLLAALLTVAAVWLLKKQERYL